MVWQGVQEALAVRRGWADHQAVSGWWSAPRSPRPGRP